MASIFQVFDLNEALAGAKQPRSHVVGGFEAPRNSLDVGSNFEFTNVSTGASSSKPEDIPFGYEYYTPALAASDGRWNRGGPLRSVAERDRPEQYSETKRRAPNVVARLMGLDAMPDELPTVRPRKSLQEMPTYGRAKAEGGNPVLIRQHSQGAVPPSWQRPPLPRNTVQRVDEERPSAPVLPFRDHPQEEQLQKFKIEFEAKQQERLRASQLDEMNRRLEEKKDKVRATLDKARIALSQGIIADPKRLNGQGKFEESKEFLDAMEFLQCNKDFIFQFLQQKPHVVFSNENSNATTPVSHVKSLKKGKGGAASPRDVPERRREGFSPRAFARLFMSSDSRKRSNDHNKQQSAATSSESQPAIERCNSTGSRRISTESRDLSDDVKLRTSLSTNSRYMLPPASPKVKTSSDEARGNNKSGPKDVIVEIKERLRRRDENSRPREEARLSTDSVIRKEHLQGSLRDSKDIAREIAKHAREAGSRKPSNSTLTKSLSTGKRISMMRPDMDDMTCTSDGEDISTPSVKIIRESVSRSCISLPSSPHLLARSHEAAATPKVTRKRATENTKPVLTDPTDSPATLRAAERAMATKKTCLTSESPRRGSPRSSTEGENRMRRSSSANENATRSNALKQKINSPVSTSKKLLDPANEPASNLTRSRSVPNVALLRERGQCTSDTARTAKGTTGAAKPGKGQAGDKRKLGFFSVGRKKGRDAQVPQATMPSNQQTLFPNPSPVLSRVAALAEACVSQSHTLSDADSAVNVRIHVRPNRTGSKKGKEKPRQVVTCAEIDQARRETSSRDESVVPESSADSDAAPCEGEFLEVLSHLTSTPKRKPTAESTKTAVSALPSTVCPPSPRTHQVQSEKKSPKPPREWKTARNILDNVDDGQESNSDKNGQPSPVSVLETPFDEESPSPLEFKEITNDLQELRIRLRLLKVDGNERSRDNVENVPEMLSHRDTQKSEVVHQSPSRTSSTNSLPTHKPTNAEKPLLPPDYPTGPEADFAFVRDILVTSGFHTHGGRNISRWHSATQPISLQILKTVEASYSTNQIGASNRRILFDAINEILVAQLEPQCLEQPWLQLAGRTATKAHFATGRKLVEEVWSEIHKRQFPAQCREFHNDHYLESLVAQDLHTSSSWLSLHRETDRICLHLEKFIWRDLMQELCRSL
ncbi:hypothetical protein KC19_7G028200 [Ceratodon purpureus]|uniref:Uncharacterized protein n=1 Tax=Ceratodon purpureus TaxID=3225 RepID=A0A8T0H6G8_CERPU|nr:hypothetical protein KC19_7G028200 [Ceratodon purpureus]